ncbi:HpcH/HpaI aldolase/citrate lyase family protein [Acidisphaera sp. L21]|uniref:HpcH/HpaI aldolase family protein n=1 Tax=Acidisphaera sp. L21 TaxID=1641851 RepID=UPI00131D6D26|nr:aldolase/citrate lyase family protein [Acidisphaera sp. L21]
MAEALGYAGCDYVYIDMEHSPNSLMSVLHQAQALAGTGASAVVRLPSDDPAVIQGLLDIGIETLVVPMVETAAQAQRVASAALYPPRGLRSAARFHRGNRYDNLDLGPTRGEDRICLIVQIESRTAIRNVAEIAAVDGIDALLFGPADLAADMGHFGQTEHPEVVAAIEDAVATILRAGKIVGMSTGEPSLAAGWLARGCSFISVGGDLPLLLGQAKRSLAAARAG